MKKLNLIALASVGVMSLTSCGRNVRHSIGDYQVFSPVPYIHSNGNGYFNVLQLSDLHIGVNCDKRIQYAFIKKTIDKANDYIRNKQSFAETNAKVDLIVISGDVFTFADKAVAKSFFSFMDEQKINWTLTFGNHDEQCYFSVDWLTGYLNDLNNDFNSYCLFKDIQDDDVFGNANFFISVPSTKGSGIEEERIYIIDSNRYRYGSYFGYDYIHNDQIDWYDRACRYRLSNEQEVDPSLLHSLMFFHIPLPQFTTYYNSANGDGRTAKFVYDVDGTKLDVRKEKESCPKEDSHLYDKIIQLNSTKGIFVGHDHVNNYTVMDTENFHNDNERVILSFGVKGTDAIYGDDDLMGGQLITVTGNSKDEKNISLHRILHKYADLEVK